MVLKPNLAVLCFFVYQHATKLSSGSGKPGLLTLHDPVIPKNTDLTEASFEGNENDGEGAQA